jgi:GNAT superfamily N-acetyltransferase
MQYNIEPATIADLPTLIELTLQEALEAENRDLSRSVVEKGIRAGLENRELAKYWVLKTEDHTPIASISIVREWSDWNAGFYWWIQSLFIQKNYRGQGLLQMLFAHVQEEASKAGAVELRLYVHRENRRACRAYEREGFSSSPYQIFVREL